MITTQCGHHPSDGIQTRGILFSVPNERGGGALCSFLSQTRPDKERGEDGGVGRVQVHPPIAVGIGGDTEFRSDAFEVILA